MNYIDELEEIRSRDQQGYLRPEAVVEYAADPSSILHEHFCWNDTKAAHEYRLWQARELIRVSVRILPKSNTPVKAYVSFMSERVSGGGYRAMADILEDDELRTRMLQEALDEFEGFRRKYEMLSELVEVFEAVSHVRGKVKSSPTAKRVAVAVA